jgi:fatty acid synthase subunit alpha
MNSEEFLKFQAEQYQFASQQIELYSRYLKKDSRAGHLKYDAEKTNSLAVQARLDAISRKHGDSYVDGILPAFDALKARRFDSSWNWARQDALLMWYDIIHGKLTTVDREITALCIDILNRADPDLYQFMQYNVNACNPTLGENYALAKQFGQQLIENCREVVNRAPLYRDGLSICINESVTFLTCTCHAVTFPTAPNVKVNENGDIITTEVMREGVMKLDGGICRGNFQEQRGQRSDQCRQSSCWCSQALEHCPVSTGYQRGRSQPNQGFVRSRHQLPQHSGS